MAENELLVDDRPRAVTVAAVLAMSAATVPAVVAGAVAGLVLLALAAVGLLGRVNCLAAPVLVDVVLLGVCVTWLGAGVGAATLLVLPASRRYLGP